VTGTASHAGSGPFTPGRVSSALVALAVATGMLLTGLGPQAAAATDPCAVPTSVACENTKPGTPQSTWDVSGSGTAAIQGFATQMSVNVGETESFKVKTAARSYRLDIYRMGYYGGNGARLVTSVTPSAALPQSQPACLSNSATGLIDCGNWAVSGSWAVPTTAVSGIYFAKLVRTDGTAGSSHVFFVVRNDASHSDLLYQTSDTTWQAYNQYGGNSLYVGNPAGRAYKVSYNRPFTTRGTSAEDWVFNSEYPMVRFLEGNGYDVTYSSGADTDRRGALLKNHKMFMSSGHDEYWSGGQRANVEAARDAGVNLAFFSGNESFWKTRWENSIDSSGTAYRTLVCYKETHAGAVIDPQDPPTWTGTWRDPRFSPPADGGRPENRLTGTSFKVNSGTLAMTVPAADGKMRFWRGTPVASQAAGATATLAPETVGYEWDEDADNGARPPGLIHLSTTTATGVDVLLDYGSSFGTGNATHNLTLYKAPSGALVFGAGTVQWAWGLDSNHDRGSAAANPSMAQATVNLFADMGVQPVTLQAGLVAATASTDTTAPTATITSPAAGATLQAGSAVTVSGTATDSGGVVGGVEVSTDGGTTWHPATGRGTWSYRWTPSASGTATIRARAIDDSGNIGTAASMTVTVGARSCPCSVWSNSVVPATPSDPDTASTEVGVKFTTDTAGTVTGIRFYKGTGNTGTHIGHLWTAGGTQLASVTFGPESATGWQQATFPTPVSVSPGVTYVASYLASNGHYAGDEGFFSTSGVDNAPLHVLRDGASGPDGVYAYVASPGGFPTLGYASSNFWVDLVFTPSGGGGTDTTPPSVTATSPAAGATGVPTTTTVTATFNEPVQASTISMALKNSAGTAISGTTSYDSTAQRATFTPSAALASGTSYTATVSGAKDLAGNTMTSSSWSFTTSGGGGTDTTPPSVTSTTPTAGATGVATTTTVTATFSEPVQASTIAMSLKNAAGTAVSGTTSYDSTAQRATFTPSAALASGTSYTATVSGAKDLAGNTMTSTSWSFTTAATPPPSCPCSIWNSTATPANPSEPDSSAVEVGVKFRADVAGKVTGVRFYKGTGNTGTHVGHLWSSTGTLLGTVTFSGETASGWQQAPFTTPVSITAGTTYVVSYYAPAGHYADDVGYFSGSGVDNGPLHALADGVSGANGVYRYGTGGGFPTSSWQGSNYWVDLTFTPN
jgi:methionine-rich copper-binding protein CopC